MAAGNVDPSTGAEEVITGPGAGGGPDTRVWRINSNGTGTLLSNFNAYSSGFSGGVRVGAADMDSDSADEILTAPGSGQVLVKSFNFPATTLASLDAYPGFGGGGFVAGGNLTSAYPNHEIVTGPGPGGGPDVRSFISPAGGLIANFNAYAQGFAGGVRVAAGNYDGDSFFEIVTGPGSGGGPDVRAYDYWGALIAAFNAYDAAFTGGVYVAGGNVQPGGNFEIVTGAGEGGGPHVRIWTCCGASQMASFFAY